MRTTESEIMAAVTNGADATYYYYLSMKLVNALALQLVLGSGSGSVTVTVEGTIRDDGTDKEDLDYADVTDFAFGSASYTASDILIDNEGILAMCRWIRVKVVASTGGADDADWTIYAIGKG